MITVTNLDTVEAFHELQKSLRLRQDPRQTVISVCGFTGCKVNGSGKLAEALNEEVRKQGQDDVPVKVTGCHGFCEKGPLVVILPQGIFYQKVGLKDVKDIVEKTVIGGEIIPRLLYRDPRTREQCQLESEVPFYAKQQRVVCRHSGKIDAAKIEDYISVGGYSWMVKALTKMTPEEVVDEVKRSGLRGRGGAGFPTGKKWEFCRMAKGNEKFIICNGDEGDPGAFMDGSIMDGHPHAVLEGMLIGAYAIGATHGYLYVRTEYPLAIRSLTRALEQAHDYGLLGENILSTGFSFDLELTRGAGAFVCGEETALMASIEGNIGSPRQRPPFPAVSGLWGKPTNINNVETWANVPVIIGRGADWFASIGTEGSKGTKVFSLVGKVNNTGLVEVPMGMTLREIVYDIGGGVQKGRKLKAVQTGGPSGGCIPESLMDLRVDFDELVKAGGMMGSGGLIVMDERTCMVDVARYFLEFLTDESCGKCTPCREGVLQMHEILERICAGEGKPDDIATLEELAAYVKDSSLCALGGTAPNPVLSTIKHFRHEYEAHIQDRKCPAGVCKTLIQYYIDPDACEGCMRCAKECPQDAISGEKKQPHTLDRNKCIKCGVCYETCPFDAIVTQ